MPADTQARTVGQAGRHGRRAAGRMPHKALRGQVQPLVLAVVVQHVVPRALTAPGQHLAAVHARFACAATGRAL